jgi:hypothetical protein
MKYAGRISAAIVTTLALALASQANAATNLLVNGNFDAVSIGSQSYYNIGANGDHASLTGFGWTVTTNNVDIVNAAGIYGGSQPADGASAQLLDLVGYGATGGISQTFATQKGATYRLSFDYSNNPYSTHEASAAVQVVGASSLLGATVDHTGAVQHGNLGWATFTGSFTADSGQATLSLAELIGGASGGVYLEDISVVETSAPPPGPGPTPGPTPGVPEPATWAMLILGVFGVGAVRRRQTAHALA